MVYNLNLLHLLLALAAAGCVRLALLELAGRSMSPSRLAALPLLAIGMTFVFLLFYASLHQPLWLFGMVLLAGLTAGAVRGATLALRFDHMYRLVRPPRHRLLLWVALGMSMALVLEAAGAVAGGSAGALVRAGGALLAALCSGALSGRALAVAFRLNHVPHEPLRR